MGDLKLDEQRKNTGERMGEYCGARAVAGYGDPAAEFQALRKSCGVCSLTWRKRLRITGEDRVRWLNGMVTNNIRDLAPGHGVYAFLLNAQGRIQADMYCFHREQEFIVETDAWQMEHLRATFDKYIIMDDVEVAEAENVTKLLVAGPKSPETVSRILGSEAQDLSALEFRPATHSEVPIAVIRLDDPATPQFELLVANEHAADLWKALAAAGAQPVGFEALEMLRIWSGRPRFGQDIRERDLPQETGQDRALHFNKGCYVGQEIVERIHSRGAVHRTFVGFAFESGPPAVGSKVLVEGKEVGEITSAATLPGDEGPPLAALGYIRREHAKPETVVQAGGMAGRVAKPPLEYVKANT